MSVAPATTPGKPPASWAVGDKRLRDDSLATLSRYNEATDRRRIRRELSADEFHRLVAAAENYTHENHRTTGVDRAMLYRLAAGTGFRASELRSLTPESFALDGQRPTVTVAAAYSKRRRKDAQEIRPDLAELFRGWVAGKSPGNPVFAAMPRDLARLLRIDLALARTAWIEEVPEGPLRDERRRSDFLEYRNQAGDVFDFHAFRNLYCSAIAASGASTKVLTDMARHSDPKLTIKTYARTRLHDVDRALDALPAVVAPPSTPPTAEPMRATGTYDARPVATCADTNNDHAVCAISAAHAQRAGRESRRSGATPCETAPPEASTDGEEDGPRKSARHADLGGLVQANAKPCESGGHGSRTRNPLRGTTFPVWQRGPGFPRKTRQFAVCQHWGQQ